MRLTRCEVGTTSIATKTVAGARILQSLAATKISKTLHLREFRSPAVFEFFNTICQGQTSRPRSIGGFSSLHILNCNADAYVRGASTVRES